MVKPTIIRRIFEPNDCGVMMKNLKIILVESNTAFRLNLKKLLEEKFQAEVISEASSGSEFEQIGNIDECDIILMDTKLPDANGYALTNKALWKNSRLNFIAIPFRDHKVCLESLLSAGFKGCVFKNNIFNELPKALKAVKSHQMYFPCDISLRETHIVN